MPIVNIGTAVNLFNAMKLSSTLVGVVSFCWVWVVSRDF